MSGRYEDKSFLITPTGFAVENMGHLAIRELVRVSIGNEFSPRASSETPLHALIYERFQGLNGICHAHLPSVMALGAPDKWPGVTDSAAKYMPVHVAAGTGKALASSVSNFLDLEDEKLISKYGFTVAVLNHGIFVAAKTLERALYLLFRIEENAMVALFSGRRDDE